MLLLTSPAKTLTESGQYPAVTVTQAQLLTQSAMVHSVLKQQSAKDLTKLMHISSELAELNFERFNLWHPKHTVQNSRPALFSFNGDIFKAMSIAKYTPDQLEYCNDHLRILSGLYGVLRPFDLLKPYRLEMGTSIEIYGQKLVQFWQQYIADVLEAELAKQKNPLVVNVASKEYFDSVDTRKITAPILHITFLQHGKNGLQTYGILAKKARGMFIDFCVTTLAQRVEDIALFKSDGYKLVEQKKDELVFVKG